MMPYLDSLSKEISIKYKEEELQTLYIGGGTPSSLDNEEFEYLLKIVNRLKRSNECEFTVEINIEHIDETKLLLMKKYGVNRLSIGVQTLNQALIKYLGRNHDEKLVFEKINLAKEIGFKNINIDLMYAIKNETLDDLKYDLKKYKELDIPHISTYSLIIEKNTILSINKEEYIDEELDFEMYELILKELSDYNHYEVSNFAKNGFESRHNLTYWNNEKYYGFGLSASGYEENTRYTNTRNLLKYIDGVYDPEIELISETRMLEDEFILGFRKIKGINKKEFYLKYGYDIKSNKIINKLLKENKLTENDEFVCIRKDLIYTSNDILINFLVENED